MSADFSTSRTRKARKQHRCEGCRQAIAPGTTYVDSRGATDGHMWQVRHHPDCSEVEIAGNKDTDLGEWYPLHELVTQDRAVLKDAPPAVVARFPPRA